MTTAGLKDNLRHLRIFLSVAITGSVTKAAQLNNLTQPAVTQALSKLERIAGGPLFVRGPNGAALTELGSLLAGRVRRAFAFLDPRLADLSPRLSLTVTTPQLRVLIAVRDTENFTLAASRLGIAQPTAHRAFRQLEHGAGRALLERTPSGLVATRPARTLATAAQLAYAEFDQAEAELAEMTERGSGQIVIGAMPLSRSYLLPQAIAAFRADRPSFPIQVVEGPYSTLLTGLRRGEIDFLIGALREPAPVDDVEQSEMFSDTVVLVSGGQHPLAKQAKVEISELAAYPWVVAERGTPIRSHFDRLFAPLGDCGPSSLVESSSVILMRELLDISDHLGCISLRQAEAEISRGLMRALPIDLSHTSRPIGLTTRKDWLPTRAQKDFVSLLSSSR